MVDLVSKTDYSNPVSGFTKLFESIIHSTVWETEMHVKITWITMLAMANRNGDVCASVPGLAKAAGVSLPQVLDALKILSSPDKWSRTKAHEGRRIEEIEGGWHLLNYTKYREQRDADERRIQTREAVARHRRKSADVSNVSHGKPRKAQAEAEAEADKDQKLRRIERAVSVLDVSPDDLMEAWNSHAVSLPRCHSLSEKRRRVAAARLRERPSLGEWRAVIQRIEASEFCRGVKPGAGSWVATFDWLLQPDTALKVLEGKYDNRDGMGDTKGARTVAAGNRLQAKLDAGAILDPFGTNAYHEAQRKLAAKAGV